MAHVNEIEFYWPTEADPTHLVFAFVGYVQTGPCAWEPTATISSADLLTDSPEPHRALTAGELAAFVLAAGEALLERAREVDADQACSREEQAYERRLDR